MSFTVGQRVVKTACSVPCKSDDCTYIPVGSVGKIITLMDKNRSSIAWEHRQYAWWVWNHGLASVFKAKLYTDL